VPSSDRDVLARNVSIRNEFRGQTCFVLANGPSLRDVDLQPLAGRLTIVMNHFNQHQALKSWQPSFHCVAEPADRYRDASGEQYLAGMLAGYTTTTHVFPIGARPYLLKRGLAAERLLFFRDDGRPASDFDAIDFTRAVPSPHDTSILSICLAIALGCTPIVLLGLNYDSLSHRSTNAHFYDDESMTWPVEDMAKTPYLQAMSDAIPAWEAHAALRRIAEANGQTILNASRGTFLDAYPIVDAGEVVPA
jgi:hypothetical protein